MALSHRLASRKVVAPNIHEIGILHEFRRKGISISAIPCCLKSPYKCLNSRLFLDANNPPPLTFNLTRLKPDKSFSVFERLCDLDIAVESGHSVIAQSQ
jgi:hypothetical protein